MSGLTGLIAGLALASAQQAPPPPAPYPDPTIWWSPEVPRPPPEVEPLYNRRPGRDEQPIPIDNGVPPLLYRLWGLQPLQSQVLKRGELILEVWARPARGVRQALVRVTLRRDGRAFVQARAGLGCCTPEIGRRVDINAELAALQIAPLRALPTDPAWSQPRSVIVDYGGGAVSALCVDGVSWDVTLLVPGQARHLRRACDDAEVGSIASILTAALGAVVGRDPRFDAVLPRGADFSRQRRAYEDLLAGGGGLRAGESNRPQPPAVPPPPEDGQPD
ncbi:MULTISPECIES: hypothetical protein [unclassified Caulobacter]|jgi:hypothetical protein|uniref:hypothetical protein n=1 Tax=unclassified Caulobacter TaxID=2648921 RepID=UPI0006F6A4F9|nr:MULTISPECIES: hypothetical protein [unclassified Caulobacter]KQV58301.1 hypothetical protein ASC62_05715 [Caulobacter sp. Root342]KQV69193.1 hypothetical protein ASC70_10320 [Caulobacter sp. Root343]